MPECLERGEDTGDLLVSGFGHGEGKFSSGGFFKELALAWPESNRSAAGWQGRRKSRTQDSVNFKPSRPARI